ncbi:Ribosomal protein S6 kinase-like 1 [Apodemus speciosus]|uniref:Ribosomal protein S6 kinase-like 1 n=1 Tax=Apodemus speciosus TaxID=105296 RepID=A0ABQ0FF24_APOSI
MHLVCWGRSSRATMSLVACECPPGPGLEPEPCSRARSQACVYLEQIRNRVATGTADVTKRDYLVDAATQIHLALERDVSEDYEAAFNHYQNGVDALLRGVHVDPSKEKCEAVKLKSTSLRRSRGEIFNCHLQRTLGSGASPNTRGVSVTRAPAHPHTELCFLEQLKGYKVVGIIRGGHVQVVQDPATGGTFILKSLPRCHMASRERLTIIPRGVPYMTKLLRYFVSEDSIFLHLEHVQAAHFQNSGLKSGSAQEKPKAPLGTGLSLMTPAKLPPGPTSRQDRIPVEPPWTFQSLPPALRLQKGADTEPSSRTSAVCSSGLTEARCGQLQSQVRRAGQSSNSAPTQRLHWVREGADRVLGAYGRGRGRNPPSANGAGLGTGRAAWSLREGQVKQWAAEMLLALEALHQQGVLCRDLNPQNLLLDQAEVGGISELTEACDWWSYGSLLYELLTGMLLQFDPQRRLGAGGGGTRRLKSHPFFSTIQWSRLTG